MHWWEALALTTEPVGQPPILYQVKKLLVFPCNEWVAVLVRNLGSCFGQLKSAVAATLRPAKKKQKSCCAMEWQCRGVKYFRSFTSLDILIILFDQNIILACWYYLNFFVEFLLFILFLYIFVDTSACQPVHLIVSISRLFFYHFIWPDMLNSFTRYVICMYVTFKILLTQRSIFTSWEIIVWANTQAAFGGYTNTNILGVVMANSLSGQVPQWWPL